MDLENYTNFLKVARGELEADLVLSGAKIVNVFTEDIYDEDIAIYKNLIVGLGKNYSAKNKIDLKGRYLVPGFIESHIHIESTFLNPVEFSKVVAAKGTCCVVCDPHEIANVWGIKGIELFIDLTQNLPVDIFFMAPSCVPASNFETSGANLNAQDINYLFSKYPNRFLGLAEVMNFPGAYLGDKEVLEKIKLAKKKKLAIDGHAPLLKGKFLNAYILAGAKSDHECTLLEEALEKLRKGMHIFIREGSSEKNLESLLPLINYNTNKISLATDDKHADELYLEGHLDHLLRKCVQHKVDPIKALKLVTYNPASYFGLTQHGAIAPGYIANLVILKDLNTFEIEDVILKGKFLKEYKEAFNKNIAITKRELNFPTLSLEQLKIKNKGKKIKVIKIVPKQIITEKIIVDPLVQGEEIISDTKRDIIKLAVIERHQNSGNIGLGFVQGLGLKIGSIASTIAHDSHNLIVAGTNDQDMVVAANFLKKEGGGIVLVKEGEIVSFLSLPLAGLMSLKKAEEVVKELSSLDKKAKEVSKLGSLVFMHLSFLALPVIPKLKLTDKGLFDGEKFSFTSLFD